MTGAWGEYEILHTGRLRQKIKQKKSTTKDDLHKSCPPEGERREGLKKKVNGEPGATGNAKRKGRGSQKNWTVHLRIAIRAFSLQGNMKSQVEEKRREMLVLAGSHRRPLRNKSEDLSPIHR